MSIPVKTKELSLTEGRGTGIPAIYEAIEKNGSPAPRFNTDDPERRFFFVAFDALFDSSVELESGVKSDRDKGGQIGGLIGEKGGPIGGPIEDKGGQITNKQQMVLNIISQEPGITKPQLSEQLGINPSAVQKHLKALKDKGWIKRVGGTRGYWEVLR